jgi:hypothetical protein
MLGREAPELDQSRFVRMQRQTKLLHPLLQRLKEANRLEAMLEPHNGIV